MAGDSSRFREYGEGDSPYFLSNAILHYLLMNTMEAFDLADQICDANGESRLLSWDDCWEIIGKMTPDDAFCAGMRSDPIAKVGYHTFDGERFRRIPDFWAYMKDIFTFASEDIANGRYEISDGLRAAIDAAKKGDLKNCNARPKAGSKARKASNNGRPKAKASARKPAKAASGRRRS